MDTSNFMSPSALWPQGQPKVLKILIQNKKKAPYFFKSIEKPLFNYLKISNKKDSQIPCKCFIKGFKFKEAKFKSTLMI